MTSCKPAIRTASVACSDASDKSECPIFQRMLIFCWQQIVLHSQWVDFTVNHLKGKSLAIACPKLDHGTEIYVEKLTAMIDISKVNTITVMMMEVPCCGGLLQMVKAAASMLQEKYLLS